MQFVRSLSHPDEIFALARYGLGLASVMPTKGGEKMTPTMVKCYELLDMTSRSFSAVIRALDGELRPAICLFYLVLRGLDTIEDDMTIPIEKKVPLLRNFYKRIYERGWTFTESGENEKDRHLLVQFDQVICEFLSLAPFYQEVISDITRRMGDGMAEYLTKTVTTMEEWDQYCHYVAGLVGIGLSRLFSASGLEDPIVGKDERLANSMGLFLQKTNIIRDYLEDIIDGRIFWPKQTWSKYRPALADFRAKEHRREALGCLNDLITNALAHVPDVFEYMSRIRNQSVFNFCAIPQVMAIATLSLCYDNGGVFEGVVKIRKGLAVKLMLDATNMDALHRTFADFASDIERCVRNDDPNAATTRLLASKVVRLAQSAAPVPRSKGALDVGTYPHGLIVIVLLMASYYFTVHRNH